MDQYILKDRFALWLALANLVLAGNSALPVWMRLSYGGLSYFCFVMAFKRVYPQPESGLDDVPTPQIR
jgi:hypothetical protein